MARAYFRPRNKQTGTAVSKLSHPSRFSAKLTKNVLRERYYCSYTRSASEDAPRYVIVPTRTHEPLHRLRSTHGERAYESSGGFPTKTPMLGKEWREGERKSCRGERRTWPMSFPETCDHAFQRSYVSVLPYLCFFMYACVSHQNHGTTNKQTNKAKHVEVLSTITYFAGYNSTTTLSSINVEAK